MFKLYLRAINQWLCIIAVSFIFISCSPNLEPRVIYKNDYIPQKCQVSIPVRQSCQLDMMSNPLQPRQVFTCMKQDKAYTDKLEQLLKFCTGSE